MQQKPTRQKIVIRQEDIRLYSGLNLSWCQYQDWRYKELSKQNTTQWSL